MDKEIKLKAKSARHARTEAKKYAPCKLQGANANGKVVYLSEVRDSKDKAHVATATIPGERAVDFIAIPK